MLSLRTTTHHGVNVSSEFYLLLPVFVRLSGQMTDSPGHLKSQFFPPPSSLSPAVSKDEGGEKLLRIPTQTDESISGPEWADRSTRVPSPPWLAGGRTVASSQRPAGGLRQWHPRFQGLLETVHLVGEKSLAEPGSQSGAARPAGAVSSRLRGALGRAVPVQLWADSLHTFLSLLWTSPFILLLLAFSFSPSFFGFRFESLFLVFYMHSYLLLF